MKELSSGRYPRSWAALNDRNASVDSIRATLIDEFEAPGGSAARGYGPAAGDMQRARAYKPPKAGDVQVTDLPPPDKAKGGLPPGFSAQAQLPAGFSALPPGRQDPSIAAHTPQAETWKDTVKRYGDQVIQKLKDPELLAKGLGKVGEYGGRAVDAMLTPTGPLDPLNAIPNREKLIADVKAYLFEGGNLAGPEGTPGLKRPAKPAEAPKAVEAAKPAAEPLKATGTDPLGQSVTRTGAPPVELAPSELRPAAAGAATTPLHEIAAQNIRDFEAANAEPGFRQKLKNTADYAKTFFERADTAKAIIQRNQGNMNRMGAQAKEAMVPFQKFVRGLNPQEQMDMIEWLETPGQKRAKGLELNDEAQGFADTFKTWMQKYADKIKALPDKDQLAFRQDFVTHLYRDPKDSMAAINEYGAKKGSGYFTKGRIFDTYADAIRSGKALLTTDPMEIFSRYIENASRKIASWETLSDAKDNGLAVYRKHENAPAGWEPLKGETDGFGHQLYAPPGFSNVYNNWQSRAAQVMIPGTQVDIFDAAQRAATTATGIKLSLSAFHPALVAMESIVSGVADGITAAKNGHPISGIAKIASAPAKPFTGFYKGRQAQKAFLDDSYGDPVMQQVIQGLTDANYDFMHDKGLADEYRESKLPGFIKGWQRGVPVTAGGPIKMGIRAFNTIMEPTFQYYVPFLKNQAAMARMRTWLEAHPNATREEFADYGRVVESQQSDRMGEMNNDTNFLPATAKKMARAAMLSYSFTLGQAKNALGAAWDASRIPDRTYRAIKGTKPSTEEIWTDRLSYAVAAPLTIAFVSSVYQYFLGAGELPKDASDLLNPRTGGTDPATGKPERATLPSFTNAYRNIWEGNARGEAFNKLNPLWQTVWEATTNKDFAGQDIRDLNSPGATQLKQLGEFAGQQAYEPVGIQNTYAAKAGSKIGTVERMFGVRAAGRRDTDPEGFQKMMSYENAKDWFASAKMKLNQQRYQQGLGPLRIPYKTQQRIIQYHMKHPETDILQGYGGTQ
jgi:hypothetical protein